MVLCVWTESGMGIQTGSRLEAPWGNCAVRCGPEGSAVITEKRDLLHLTPPLSDPPLSLSRKTSLVWQPLCLCSRPAARVSCFIRDVGMHMV